MGTAVHTETRTDDLGEYIVFSGKFCRVRAVGLTNRNRYTDRSLCLEHGREKERTRVRVRNRPVAPPFDNAAKAPSIPPLAKPFHDAMTAWLNNPSDSENTRVLKSALDLYEMNFLLRKRLPPLPPYTAAAPAGLQGLPIEEPTFDSPNHRTTHAEFMSDLQTYGVK
jgi:hypothetical protein